MGCGGEQGSQASPLGLKLNLRVSRPSRLSRRDGVAYRWHRGNSWAQGSMGDRTKPGPLDTALETALCLHVSLLHGDKGLA